MGAVKDIFLEMREQDAFAEKSLIRNITKEDIISRAQAIEESVQEGYLDPLDTLIQAKKMQELGKSIEAKIRPIAEDKVRLAKGEIYSRYGVSVSQKVNGARTDYSACQDPVWQSINEDMEKLKAELKEREKFLSGISKPTEIVLNEAEVYTIYPPVKSGKIGLSLEIK